MVRPSTSYWIPVAIQIEHEEPSVIEWQHFPTSSACPVVIRQVIEAFESVANEIDSDVSDGMSSDEVLSLIEPGLRRAGFEVETGKSKHQVIEVPVLFGRNDRVEKSFKADAVNWDAGVVVEVEAGRAVANNAFLKDLFEACMMHEVTGLLVAVRRTYRSGSSKSKDFERVLSFFETLYASGRLSLPLSSVVVLGY